MIHETKRCGGETMKEKEFLSRVNNFYDGEASYGDPAIKILQGITSESAHSRPSKNAHSPAELLAHIVGWDDVYLKRIQGDKEATIDQEFSFDWRRIDKNEKSAWRSLTSAFEKNRDRLNSILQDMKYDVEAKENLVNNIMEHNIYHLGQISMIKKMLP